MNIIAINVTLVGVIVLPIVAIILGVTIYFFLKSRESLLSLQPQKLNLRRTAKEKIKKITISQKNNQDAEEILSKKFEAYKEERSMHSKKPASEENMAQEMKATIAEQQRLLNSYLEKVEEMEQHGKEELIHQNNALQKEINKLHGIIEQKDGEIEELEQHASTAKKMAEKIEEVYQEFDQLQEKMSTLEKQAHSANQLAMELEDAKNAYEQVHKELLRKQDKLEEFMDENQEMKIERNMLEDKLSESNLQRQQLLKKVQFLQEINTDMQSISDTNKKLQTELRRIGELESMLNIMAEERDFLLRKKSGK